MKLFSSLTNRIFMASALLAVLSIAFAIYFVNVKVTTEAERELQRGVEEAGTLVDQHRTTLVETYTLLARTIADLPKLKAAVTTDAATVQPIAVDYRTRLKSDVFVVTDRTGRVFAAIGESSVPPDRIPELPAVRRALAGRETSAFWPHPQGVLQVVTVPISIGLAPPEILGTLSVGFLLDNDLASQFKELTDSEIAFAVDGQIRATTLGRQHHDELTRVLRAGSASRARLGGSEYIVLLRPFTASSELTVDPETGQITASPIEPHRSADVHRAGTPVAMILRSRTERLRFLSTIHTALAVTALLAVLLATVLSYAVARTVTRPLAAITAGMREMAATGDLTRKIALHRSGRWDDEDARLLASTFNTLTDSIRRFQREAAQRERLSSLGRLSTVVAHEIRNPLMIIKASLRTLRREDVPAQEMREAVLDVDEEVARLNRVVGDVLDFARPIHFEYAEADLNTICADSVAAIAAEEALPLIDLRLDPLAGHVITDAERLRTALVNILSNARHAVASAAPADRSVPPRAAAIPRAGVLSAAARGAAVAARPLGDATDIEVSTSTAGADRVILCVRDRGPGIEPGDLARVFDPYFTTKRTGTGLGLAIGKNIIEGLGGTIVINSRSGEGTEIRVELPRDSRPAAAPRA